MSVVRLIVPLPETLPGVECQRSFTRLSQIAEKLAFRAKIVQDQARNSSLDQGAGESLSLLMTKVFASGDTSYRL